MSYIRLIPLFVMSAVTLAAPVPKLDPEVERITKKYGAITEQVGVKLKMDEKNRLTVTLDKARLPKIEKPGEKGEIAGKAISEPSNVKFNRPVKGAFTATVRFHSKSDLTRRPDDLGIGVSLSIEYPSGVSASIDGGYHLDTFRPLDQPEEKRVAISFSSHTNDGSPSGFRGKMVASGTPTPGEGTLQSRIRYDGKTVYLETQIGAGAWQTYDEMPLKDAGAGKVQLHVYSYYGAETEFILDQFEVK